MKCPNCGAELKANKCDYCKSEVSMEEKSDKIKTHKRNTVVIAGLSLVMVIVIVFMNNNLQKNQQEDVIVYTFSEEASQEDQVSESVTSITDNTENQDESNSDSQDTLETLVYKKGQSPLLYDQDGLSLVIKAGKYGTGSGYEIEFDIDNSSKDEAKIEFKNTYFDDIYVKEATTGMDFVIDKSTQWNSRFIFWAEDIKNASVGEFKELTGEIVVTLSRDGFETSREVKIPVIFEYSFFQD